MTEKEYTYTRHYLTKNGQVRETTQKIKRSITRQNVKFSNDELNTMMEEATSYCNKHTNLPTVEKMLEYLRERWPECKFWLAGKIMKDIRKSRPTN